MAIATGQAQLLSLLQRRGLWGGIAAVCELGSQEPRTDELGDLMAVFGKTTPVGGISARMLYELLGIGRYVSIDFNGEQGARPFDLNRNLRSDYQFTETFDLVTNFGTSEHCFNQFEVFRNIHQLCKPGGYILHTVPSQGWGRHCLVRYDVNFFEDLAAANGYEILWLEPFLRLNALLKKDKSQALGPLKILYEFVESRMSGVPAEKLPDDVRIALERITKGDATINITLGCVLRKTAEREFATPIQGVYRMFAK